MDFLHKLGVTKGEKTLYVKPSCWGSRKEKLHYRKSIHNVRIERLWRDLYNGCICYFYQLFVLLEEASCLDPDNPIDIFSLHYAYIPWVQHQLDIFQKVWSQHKLRTAKHKSPLQLWITGMLTRVNIC